MSPARSERSDNGRTADPIGALEGAVRAAARELAGAGAVADGARLERPPRADFGDFSSNAPMLLAPTMGKPPREVAESLGARVGETLGAVLDRTEVAGPGFLNLFLADAWFREALGAAAAGEDYGRNPETGQRFAVLGDFPQGVVQRNLLASGRRLQGGLGSCLVEPGATVHQHDADQVLQPPDDLLVGVLVQPRHADGVDR